MPADKPLGQTRLAQGWFGLGALVAFATHAMGALAGTTLQGPLFRPLDFDPPLRLLEIVYASRGLVPYKDFGFVYPPGQVWLYGKVLHLREPASINVAIALVSLLLWGVCALLLFGRLRGAWGWFWAGTVLLVPGGMVTSLWGYREQIPLLGIAVLLMVAVLQQDQNRNRLVLLAAVAALETLLRWDWVLFLGALEAGWAAVAWLLVLRLKGEQAIAPRATIARLWRAAGAILAGMALALAAIAVSAWWTGAWASARFFIFYLPFHIAGFRHLPLAGARGVFLLFYPAIAAVAAIALAATVEAARSRSGFASLVSGGALVAACLGLAPYAVGRADIDHFFPLSMLAAVALGAAFALRPGSGAQRLLLAALVVDTAPTFLALIVLAPNAGALQADMALNRAHRAIAACTQLFPADARSLFVGQASYDRFLINSPMIYLMRPDLRPATPFISDEPGLQNDCALGARIAQDLARAPRPLVLVLDATAQPTEPNLTRTMKNCGKVEEAIRALRAQVVGSCQVPSDYVPAAAKRAFHVAVVR